MDHNLIYFEYTKLNGYSFKGYIQLLERFPDGHLQIYFNGEAMSLHPEDGDCYKAGPTYTYSIITHDPLVLRWLEQ